MYKIVIMLLICLVSGAHFALCQQEAPPSDSISRPATAIGYQVEGDSTEIDLKATGPVPQAMGEAKIEATTHFPNIEVKLKGMTPASKLGVGLLTYVLWVVSPDCRTSDLD